MSQRQISAEMRKQISHEHISYEIQMFDFTARKLGQGNLDLLENNAMLETFLIHARCLLDFLYPAATLRPDDVIADDFFDDPQVLHSALPKNLPMADFLRKRTGKEVAHLTYKRLNIDREQKLWNFTEICQQLGEALAIFFEQLTSEQRQWFTTIVKR